jgi:hypothetical protein
MKNLWFDRFGGTSVQTWEIVFPSVDVVTLARQPVVCLLLRGASVHVNRELATLDQPAFGLCFGGGIFGHLSGVT